MKLFIQRVRLALPTTIFVTVAACSSAPDTYTPAEVADETPTNFYLGSSDVFAHLASGSGGSWQFTKITASNLEPETGYLVRLNDLAPAFDTRVAECTPQAYTSSHKCNPTHPFRNKEVGVIKKIISGGIAAGTAGKVGDMSTNYRTSFDEARFNQAVDEALINSGLDGKRTDLFDVLDEYASTAAASRSELDAMLRSATATYHDTGAVALDIEPTITGLTEYYSHDLDLNELVELVPKSSTGVTRAGVETKVLLPCEPRVCLENARRELAALQADIESARMQLASAAGTGLDVYELRCDKTRHQGYLFRLQCPSEIRRAENGPVPVPLALHIYARDFDALYPSVQFEDEHLRIETDGDIVSFINKTPSYLSITTQTVYYNSLVETTASKIRVAPGARVAQPIQSLVSPAIEIESSYRQMTPDKSDSTSFEFGFAANYRVAGATTDSTLYTRRKFNAGCVIDNRLRPGTCIDTPDIDTEAGAGNAEVAVDSAESTGQPSD